MSRNFCNLLTLIQPSKPVKRRTVVIDERITKTRTGNSPRQRPRSPSPEPLSHRLTRSMSLPLRYRTERRVKELNGHVSLPPRIATKDRLNLDPKGIASPLYEDRSPLDYNSTRKTEARDPHRSSGIKTLRPNTRRLSGYEDEYELVTPLARRSTLQQDSFTYEDRIPRVVKVDEARISTLAAQVQELKEHIRRLESANRGLVDRLHEQTQRTAEERDRACDAERRCRESDEKLRELERHKRLSRGPHVRIDNGSRSPSRERPAPGRPLNSSLRTGARNDAATEAILEAIADADREAIGRRHYENLPGGPHRQTARSTNYERRDATLRDYRYR